MDVRLVERASAQRTTGAALAVDGDDLAQVIGPAAAETVLGLLGARPGSGSVPATWEALHAGLQQVALANPLVDVHYDTRVVALGQDREQAWVQTERGQRWSARVLVGADGYRSVVRRTAFPAHPEASFAGYTLWLGLAEEQALPSLAWPAGFDILSAQDSYLLGYPLPDTTGQERLGTRRLGWAWYDATRNDVLERAGAVVDGVVQHSLSGRQIPDETYRGLIRDAHRHWPSPWREAVIETLTRRAATATPIAEYVPARLVTGRVALVGDAAHVPTPMTGMGFAASLADAAAMAEAMTEAMAKGRTAQPPASVALDVPTALARFEAQRLGPAQRLVLSGQQFSRSFARAAA